MDENLVCADGGANILVDETSCRAAVEKIKRFRPATYFQRSENVHNYPKGCHLYTAGDGNIVYFNTHESGARNDDARPICKKSNGKQDQHNHTIFHKYLCLAFYGY